MVEPGGGGGGPYDDIKRCMPPAFWINKATDTQTEHVIRIAFPW
jgi:hypothetical protein